MKNAGTILGVVLLVVLVLLLLGGAGMMGFGGMGMAPGMMGGYGGYGGMMGYVFNPLGAILSLVLWALIISGIVLMVVWLARNANRGESFIGSSESPLDILKRRYAKGEVTKEQFDAIKRDLEA